MWILDLSTFFKRSAQGLHTLVLQISFLSLAMLMQLHNCFFLVFLSGHGKFETLGALGISSMLLVTAGGIAWHALDLLLV